MCFLLFIGASFCVTLVCICMFCVLVVLVKLSVPAESLARKISLFMVIRLSPQSSGQRVLMTFLI